MVQTHPPMHVVFTAPIRCPRRATAWRRASHMVMPLAVALLSTALAGCKQEIQFTRTPFAGVIETEAKAGETSVFLAVPVDVAPVIAAAETAFAGPVGKAREFVDDIACDRRKGPYVECSGAVVTTDLIRSGPIEVTADGTRLLITVPLRYDIAARGHGWANYLTDRKTGAVSVTIPFDVVLTASYGLETRIAGDLVWSEKVIPVLKGRLGLAGLADAKIKAQLKGLTEALRTTLAAQPVRDGAEKAWRALHQPIELSRGPSLWMRGQPERVFGGGFAMADGAVVYRLGMDAKISVHRGERPAPLSVKPLPGPLRQATARQQPAQTVLRLPFDVGALALGQAVAQAFPKSDVIETRADAKSQPVKVRPTAVSLFPARDRLALELQLDVVEPSRLLGMTGKAYLVGRPVLDPTTGILDLRDIGFPGEPQKPGKTPEGVLRVGEEPFAGRFASAARLDIGSVLNGLRPRINAMLSQPLDDAMDLSGSFETMTVAGVEPVKDGFRLLLDLKGALTLTARARPQSGEVPPTVRAASAISRPAP